MNIKSKPPVFTPERIAGDMLGLLLKAVAVGAAAALASGAMVAGLAALIR